MNVKIISKIHITIEIKKGTLIFMSVFVHNWFVSDFSYNNNLWNENLISTKVTKI